MDNWKGNIIKIVIKWKIGSVELEEFNLGIGKIELQMTEIVKIVKLSNYKKKLTNL